MILDAEQLLYFVRKLVFELIQLSLEHGSVSGKLLPEGCRLFLHRRKGLSHLTELFFEFVPGHAEGSPVQGDLMQRTLDDVPQLQPHGRLDDVRRLLSAVPLHRFFQFRQAGLFLRADGKQLDFVHFHPFGDESAAVGQVGFQILFLHDVGLIDGEIEFRSESSGLLEKVNLDLVDGTVHRQQEDHCITLFHEGVCRIGVFLMDRAHARCVHQGDSRLQEIRRHRKLHPGNAETVVLVFLLVDISTDVIKAAGHHRPILKMHPRSLFHTVLHGSHHGSHRHDAHRHHLIPQNAVYQGALSPFELTDDGDSHFLFFYLFCQGADLHQLPACDFIFAEQRFQLFHFFQYIFTHSFFPYLFP